MLDCPSFLRRHGGLNERTPPPFLIIDKLACFLYVRQIPQDQRTKYKTLFSFTGTRRTFNVFLERKNCDFPIRINSPASTQLPQPGANHKGALPKHGLSTTPTDIRPSDTKASGANAFQFFPPTDHLSRTRHESRNPGSEHSRHSCFDRGVGSFTAGCRAHKFRWASYGMGVGRSELGRAV